MNIEINKQARMILAGALAGALLGAVAALIYHQTRRSPAVAERAGVVAPKHIAWSKVGGLALAVVKVLREIMDLAKEG